MLVLHLRFDEFRSAPSDGFSVRNECYSSRDGDACFTIRPPQGLTKGWYRLDVRLASRDKLDPRVLFDLNSGCCDECGLTLTPVSNGFFKALVFLPEKTPSFRFFPHVSAADFQHLEFKIARAGGPLNISSLTKFVRALTRKRRQSVRDQDVASLPGNPGHFSYFDFETNRLVRLTSSYQHWIARYDYSAADRKLLENRIENLAEKPVVSIVIPGFDRLDNDLNETIRSVHRQLYQNWELYIAGVFPGRPEVSAALRRWCEKDHRIEVISCAEHEQACTAINRCFELASGKYVAVINQDAILREHALAEVIFAINEHPNSEIIYSDEDKISHEGRRFDPYFKCDWAPDLFLSQNYLNHLTVHRADNIKAVGGWREGFEGGEDYDLTLRIMERISSETITHIAKVLYHERAVKSSNVRKSCAHRAGRKAIEAHLKRTGIAATVDRTPPHFHVVYVVSDPPPAVSLIIPTRDNRPVLESCISSILEKTTYQNYQILVVNNCSKDREAIGYLKTIAQHEKITVLDYPAPFNFSAINNFAVEQAGGELIALLNNDVEVISPHWLSLMVGHAARPEIGCVGAKLYYPNDRIQHAGVILGLGGVAGHAHKYFRRCDPGYFSRLMLTQNVSAVTAACLVVRRQIFKEVGGLNEKDLTIAFNDVDFCLKVRERGYRNLFEPQAELYHHESISRGQEDTRRKRNRFRAEVNYMKRRWGEALCADPYYSPHLTLAAEDFSPRR